MKAQAPPGALKNASAWLHRIATRHSLRRRTKPDGKKLAGSYQATSTSTPLTSAVASSTLGSLVTSLWIPQIAKNTGKPM